jgi:hypothetical protein
VTHRGVAVYDCDCARRGGEGFHTHDCEGIVEGHHFAAPYAPGEMHVIVAVRTPTFDEAVFPRPVRPRRTDSVSTFREYPPPFPAS